MTTDTVTTFERSLERLDVETTRTPPSEAEEVLSRVVRAPAVGVDLPFEGVDLPASVTADPTPADLDAAATGVTPAGLGVADYGSVVVESRPDGTEPVSLYPDLHVAVLRTGDVVPGMPEAFERLGESLRAGRGSAVFATGPSATADMGALVRGVHGPSEVRVVLIESDGEGGDGDGRGTRGRPSSGRDGERRGAEAGGE